MSVLDRVNRNRQTDSRTGQRELTAGTSQTASTSSTLTRRESPTIHRLRSVFWALQKFIADNDDGSMMARMAPIMETFMDELAEELGEREERFMSMFFAQSGDIIAWVGHGDNNRLPPELRIFAEAIQPSVRNPSEHSGEPSSKPAMGTSSVLAPTSQA